MKSRWSSPTRATWLALGASIITALGTAWYLASVYAALPFGVPVRFVRGIPLIYQIKTRAVVMLPATVQAVLLLVFGLIMVLLLWRARPRDGHRISDADSYRMRMTAEGISLLALVWIVVQAFGAVRLIRLWQTGLGGFGAVYSAALIAGVVLSVAIAARTLRLVGGERAQQGNDNPAHWRLRSLYFNPRDPALFVPTRSGVGWTLNFGRPLAIALLATTLIVGIGGPYAVARYFLRGFGS
jgi:uncharacterized membrane protein